MNFPDYQVEAIDSATWLIKDQINSIVYLLEGETKALLLDTGSGVYKLRPVVEALTQKPVVVVNTHYHGDHTGANYEFDRMMISEEDRYYLEYPNDVCISTEFLRRLVPMVYGVEADAKDCRLFDEPRRTQFHRSPFCIPTTKSTWGTGCWRCSPSPATRRAASCCWNRGAASSIPAIPVVPPTGFCCILNPNARWRISAGAWKPLPPAAENLPASIPVITATPCRFPTWRTSSPVAGASRTDPSLGCPPPGGRGFWKRVLARRWSSICRSASTGHSLAANPITSPSPATQKRRACF